MSRLQELRKILKDKGLSGYYISGSDPHGSEYCANKYKTRDFISGFTGSAGFIFITLDKAYLFTDGRYFLQANNQLNKDEFELVKLLDSEPTLIDKILELEEGSKIGLDGKTIPYAEFNRLNESIGKREMVDTGSLLDLIWKDRPELPDNKIEIFHDKIAGQSRSEKIKAIRRVMRENKCKVHLVSALDDIAWILNIRSADVLHTPVAYAHLIIGVKRVLLFTNPKKLDAKTRKVLENDLIEIFDYDDAKENLESLVNAKAKLLCNQERITVNFLANIKPYNMVHQVEPSTHLKAIKNAYEIEGFRAAHLQDAIAFIRFLADLDDLKDRTEIGVANLFEEKRRMSKDYIGPSFSTISGFNANGAIIHYKVDETSNKMIDEGLLCLDSGGQYKYGTTDVTRTLLFGESNLEQREGYTLVLKAHLALSMQKFLKGTYGYQLDIVARRELWNANLDYKHGTGHGVGHCLSVHEGPFSISSKKILEEIKPSMVLSIEPGLYIKDLFGIRIENLALVYKECENDMGTWYALEALTLFPYERKLIEKSLLTKAEIKWVDEYHNWCYKELRKHLNDKQNLLLKEMTKPL